MGWFGIGEEAKGIGEGVSTVSQGIRHLITGDTPPETVIKLQELDVEVQKIHAQIVESDNKAGGINKYIRPFTFLVTFMSWVTLVWIEAFTDKVVNAGAMDRLDMLLYALIPSFFIYRSWEKFKGLTK